MEFSPVFKSMLRRPTGPILIIMQLAITIAIVSNALSFIQQRLEFVNRDTGIQTEGLLKLWTQRDSSKDNMLESIRQDLEFLRSQAAVESAVIIHTVPMSSYGEIAGYSTSPSDSNIEVSSYSNAASTFSVTEGWRETLGIELIKGRDFNPNEYELFESGSGPSSSPIIISEHIAKNLFPNEDPIGKFLYIGHLMSFEIIGVMRNVMAHDPYWETPYQTVVYPKVEARSSLHYLVRVNDPNPDIVLADLTTKLRGYDKDRIVGDEKTMKQIIDDTYNGEYAMITLLSVVLFLLVCVNALGVVGLTSFSVQQRRRQIGIRRALGATRFAIVRYFAIENVMIVGMALSIGTIAAVLANMQLVSAYNLDPINWRFIPVSGLIVLCITLGAALVPVRRAAQASPVDAVTSY